MVVSDAYNKRATYSLKLLQRIGVNTYSYDVANKLSAVKAGQATIKTNSYRSDGQRITKAEGAVAINYSDFGQTECQGNTELYNEFAYISGIYDKTTSLYYLNARYYDPADARFLTVDPVRDAATKGLYAYYAADPINGTDPSGLWDIIAKHHVTFDRVVVVHNKDSAR